MEFEAMSEDSDRSDLFGRAISLDGGLLLSGAPNKHLDVPEIQLVVFTGTTSEVRKECRACPSYTVTQTSRCKGTQRIPVQIQNETPYVRQEIAPQADLAKSTKATTTPSLYLHYRQYHSHLHPHRQHHHHHHHHCHHVLGTHVATACATQSETDCLA